MHRDTITQLQTALITAASKPGSHRIEFRENGGLRLIVHGCDISLHEAYMDVRDHREDGQSTLIELGSMLRMLGRDVELTRTVDGITETVDLVNQAVPVWIYEPQLERLRAFAESQQIPVSHAASLLLMSGLQIANWN